MSVVKTWGKSRDQRRVLVVVLCRRGVFCYQEDRKQNGFRHEVSPYTTRRSLLYLHLLSQAIGSPRSTTSTVFPFSKNLVGDSGLPSLLKIQITHHPWPRKGDYHSFISSYRLRVVSYDAPRGSSDLDPETGESESVLGSCLNYEWKHPKVPEPVTGIITTWYLVSR